MCRHFNHNNRLYIETLQNKISPIGIRHRCFIFVKLLDEARDNFDYGLSNERRRYAYSHWLSPYQEYLQLYGFDRRINDCAILDVWLVRNNICDKDASKHAS